MNTNRATLAISVAATLLAFSPAGQAHTAPADIWPIRGGCCLPNGTCVMEYKEVCELEGGTWYGPTANCSTLQCRPAPCPADFDGDGLVDYLDFLDFIGCFTGKECPAGQSADLNGDGFLDDLDINSFVEAYRNGYCV